jgi:O-antigen/teichoic acid export membrane protein
MKLSNKDYLWSYIGVFLSLFANIIMVPFIMYFLDGDNYGLWGVFQSLAGITVLFDFGFTTTFGRNINYCWNGAEKLEKTGVVFSNASEPNFYLMKKTMTACQRVFLILSSTALFLMVTLGSLYISYISRELNTSEPLIAWLIYAVAIFLNLYFGYYGSFLRGVGAISDFNKSIVFSKLAQIISTIILLWCGFGLIGTGVAYLTYGTLYRLIAKHRFYRFRGIGEGLKKVTAKIPAAEVKDMFLTVWYNAWREGLVSLSNYLSNQACTIIVSLYMPLTQTGAYSLGVQICNAVAHVAATMYSSNQPVLQSAYINNDKEAQKRTMSLIVFSFAALDIIGMLFVTTVGLPLLKLIRPETVVAPAVLLALGLYHFILNLRNCYTSYFSCTNRIPYVKAFLTSSITCIVLALIAMGALKMGMWGIIAAQLISQLMYNAWAWAVKAHKEMQLSASMTVRLGYEEMMKVVMSLLHIGRKKNA